MPTGARTGDRIARIEKDIRERNMHKYREQAQQKNIAVRTMKAKKPEWSKAKYEKGRMRAWVLSIRE
jgi:hypothetical protein